MAFWGIHVKPGQPYTLQWKNGEKRLRISQAALGESCRISMSRSSLQCVVGSKPPVILCSLTEKYLPCCQLDLEFKEPENVVFSIRGPRGIHLTGQYITPHTYTDTSSDGLRTDCYGQEDSNKVENNGDEKRTLEKDHAGGMTTNMTDGCGERSHDYNRDLGMPSGSDPLVNVERHGLLNTIGDDEKMAKNVEQEDTIHVCDSVMDREDVSYVQCVTKSEKAAKNLMTKYGENADKGTVEPNDIIEDTGIIGFRLEENADSINSLSEHESSKSKRKWKDADLKQQSVEADGANCNNVLHDIEQNVANISNVVKFLPENDENVKPASDKRIADSNNILLFPSHVRYENELVNLIQVADENVLSKVEQQESMYVSDTDMEREDENYVLCARRYVRTENNRKEKDEKYAEKGIVEPNDMLDAHDAIGFGPKENAELVNLPNGYERSNSKEHRRERTEGPGKVISQDSDTGYATNDFEGNKVCQERNNMYQDGARTNQHRKSSSNKEIGFVPHMLPEVEVNDEVGWKLKEGGKDEDFKVLSKRSADRKLTNDNIENSPKSKKRRKDSDLKQKSVEDDRATCKNVLQVEKFRQLVALEKNKGKPASDKRSGNHSNSFLLHAEVGCENSLDLDKRKKGMALEQEYKEGNFVKDDKFKRNTGDHKLNADLNTEVHSHSLVSGCQSKKKNKKNQKKKIKEKDNDKNICATLSQTRTLSNGLIIEELAVGEPGGNVASPGRKVKIFYTARLLETGKLVESNVGEVPYKFRLGDKKINMGWTYGIDGMRIGEKRRLTIPPSLGYGKRVLKVIPPNSWLVVDIELVSVC